MGWHRAGYYTPAWVDHLLFPANRPSLDVLDPTLVRDLAVGDTIPDGPHGWDARGARIVWTWCLRLAPQADGSTRVHLRVRGRMAPWWFAALYLAIIGPTDLVMATGMLRGLQARCRVSSTGPIRLPSANRGPCQAAETVDR